jgi:hypothetical protein
MAATFAGQHPLQRLEQRVAMKAGFSGAAKLIYLFYSFQCHQLPQRSFFLFGPQLTYSIEQINTARGSEI